MTEGRLSVPAREHAALVDNIGTYGRKISTQFAIAQKFFDQGLRLTFGYYFPEAIASFQQAHESIFHFPSIFHLRNLKNVEKTAISCVFEVNH